MRHEELPFPPTKIKSQLLTLPDLLDKHELGHREVGETVCAQILHRQVYVV